MAKFAFVVTYYGGNSSFLDALVLGKSLCDTHTIADRVLIARKSIPNDRLELLGRYFNRIERVEPFPVPQSLFAKDTLRRFFGVFDKLYAFRLREYSKILLLDSDMIVLRNVDEVFSFPCPAATIQSIDFAWKGGVKIGREVINAGVLQRGSGFLNIGATLLSPSSYSLEAIKDELRRIADSNITYSCPEQEFLREYLIDEWHCLPMSFNCRIIVFGYFLNPKAYGRTVIPDNISIVHFCGSTKPSDVFFNREFLLESRLALPRMEYLFKKLDIVNETLTTSHDTTSDFFCSAYFRWRRTLDIVLKNSGIHLELLKIDPFCSLEEAQRITKKHSRKLRAKRSG